MKLLTFKITLFWFIFVMDLKLLFILVAFFMILMLLMYDDEIVYLMYFIFVKAFFVNFISLVNHCLFAI